MNHDISSKASRQEGGETISDRSPHTPGGRKTCPSMSHGRSRTSFFSRRVAPHCDAQQPALQAPLFESLLKRDWASKTRAPAGVPAIPQSDSHRGIGRSAGRPAWEPTTEVEVNRRTSRASRCLEGISGVRGPGAYPGKFPGGEFWGEIRGAGSGGFVGVLPRVVPGVLPGRGVGRRRSSPDEKKSPSQP